MNQFDDEDLELIDGFREESSDHIEVIEEQLLVLENEGFQIEPINLIFRSIHTIKGGSGFLGLNSVKDLSHRMESLLDLLRNGEFEFDDQIADVLLRGTDRLKEMFNDLNHQDEVDIEDEMSILNHYLTGGKSSPKDQTKPAEPVAPLTLIPDVTWEKISSNLKKGFHFYKAAISKAWHDKKAEQGGFKDFLSYFTSFGTLLAESGLEDPDSAKATIIFGSVLEGEFASATLGVDEDSLELQSMEALKAFFPEINQPEKVKDKPGDAEKSESAAPELSPSKPKSGETTAKPAKDVFKERSVSSGAKKMESPQNLKVSTQLLGKLMTLAGELILCRNQLLQDVPDTNIPVLHTLNQRLSELQETVMKTRLQPVGSVFNKVPRMVRDLSRALNKQVEVKLDGAEVELDRTIIDAINDPLTHLVRNSIDHGFESREERIAENKPETCLLSLKAFHEGGMVNIEIKDDGRGIDVNKIKKKALEQGLITGVEAESMGVRESLNLIFRPGFSTAQQITELSGRGVGMDVVKTSFERIGGTVDLFSELGLGTTVLVKLPTTLAIVTAIIANVEQHHFAISQGNIEEIVRLKENELTRKLERIGSFEILRLRGRLLPVIRLADVLKIKRTFVDTEGVRHDDRRQNLADRRGLGSESDDLKEMRKGKERRKKGRTFFIVVVRVGMNQFGILIDGIQNTEEIVIKPLSAFVKQIESFHGATIRGDGRVIMILDCNGLAKTANLKFSELEDLSRSEEKSEVVGGAENQTLLVFTNHEDEFFALPLSFITRIEKVYLKDIKKVGDREFIHLSGKNVPLLRLENKLNVHPVSPNEDGSFFLLIPNMVESKEAIVCGRVIDVISSQIELETNIVKETGVLGTCVLNEQTTLIVDIYGLLGEHRETESFTEHAHKILLVEDTPFFRSMITTYLKQAGFTVELAVNGAQAWDMLQQNEYDLVLSDIEMPVMDGYELVQKIKTDPNFNHLPVMAITALDNPKAKAQGRKSGFDSYQVKLDKTALISAINNLIALSKGQE